MFPDARVAPVHKDGSFTLVSSGLKDHLEDKLYNSTRTGADFKKCIQEAFAMVRTEQVTMLDESRRATMFLPLSVMLLGRPSPFVVLDADTTVRNNPDGSPLAANAVAQRYTELPTPCISQKVAMRCTMVRQPRWLYHEPPCVVRWCSVCCVWYACMRQPRWLYHW